MSSFRGLLETNGEPPIRPHDMEFVCLASHRDYTYFSQAMLRSQW